MSEDTAVQTKTGAKRKGFKLADRVKAIALESKGVWLEIADELGEETGAAVLIFGSNSPQYRAAENWRRSQVRDYGRKLTDEETHSLTAGFLSRCCGEWREFVDDKGTPIAFSYDELAKAIEAFPPLHRQIDSAVVETKRFLAKKS